MISCCLSDYPHYIITIGRPQLLNRMRRKNYKIREFALKGAKINCGSFSKKIAEEEDTGDGDGDRNSQRHEYFATGDTHNNVRFYEFSGEEELQTFNSNINQTTVQSEVSAVAISWEEKSIFSGSNRGSINIWDILGTKNTPVLTLRGHATSVNCFGLFPETENRIASGSYDTHIKLWDLRTKDSYAMLKNHTRQINSIDVSPDCHYLISGSEDNSIKLWDVRYPQKIVSTYSEHNAPVVRVKFNPEDCMFASSSMDRTAKYFRCEHKHYDFITSTQLVSVPMTAIDFNPEGNLLCTGGNDTLKIWDMDKNGVLVDAIDTAWKGVQDVLWCEKGIKGIASSGSHLSTWFCLMGARQQSPTHEKSKQPSLPRIFKNPSIKRDNESNNGSRNASQKNLQREKDLQQVMQNINFAMGLVKNLEGNEDDLQKKKRDQEKQRARIESENKREEIRKKKQKEKQQKEQKDRELRERIEREKQEEQRSKQQRLQAMAKERSERQRILEEKLHDTFDKNNNKQLEITLENDVLESSSVMNLSTFMGEGLSKEKLRQMELMSELSKDAGKFESVYTLRSKNIKPIIHLWKQGKVQNALLTLNRADLPIAYDCISAILHNPKFKFGITPDVACVLIKKLVEIMHNKHSTYVKNSMYFLNDLVLMFKDELIKVKMFNPMTRVDLSREERMAKYDRLTEEFLNLFKDERLNKYSSASKAADNEQLHSIASELHRNLEEMLRKIVPRKQPEPV